MHSETIDYQDGDTQLEAYVTWDDSISGPRAGVLVAHDWTGRRDFATSKADEMAALGYVGFALDMYGKGVFGADGDVEGNSALMGALAGDRGMLRGQQTQNPARDVSIWYITWGKNTMD